jgi:hypothetical protein
VKLTSAEPLPATTALTAVGAPGAPTGVTWFEGAEAGPVPTAFVARTVNVYAVPSVRPVIVIGLPVPVAVRPPGEAVIVYEVIDDPCPEGAVNATVASPVAVGTAPTLVGAAGVPGITALDGADVGPVPTALVAVTVIT